MSSQQVHFVALTTDPTIRQSLGRLFPRDGWVLDLVDTPGAVVDQLTDTAAAVLIDELLEPAYLTLIKRCRRAVPGVSAIVVGGPKSDSVRRVERAEGVDLYIDRPIEPAPLRGTLDHHLSLVLVKAQAGLVGRSPAVEELLESLMLVAPTEVPILIQGESGTGKDIVAHAIHAMSRRSERPFEAINCGSLAEGVLESELFGHERGAFTGAVSRRAGMFERANSGTIFLDEVGEMSANMQVRLLRVLETGEVLRVGGASGLTVDVRVIGATNRNLGEAARTGTFRQDLYYRLKGVTLYLPPLRERKSDIPILVHHFIRMANRSNHKSVRGLDPDAMQRFEEHNWPGNIRELKNLVETLVVLAPGPRITRALVDAHLGDPGPAAPGPFLPVPVARPRDDAEREVLYGLILALHRDVREILRQLRDGPGPSSAGPWGGLREVAAGGDAEGTNLSLSTMERAAVKEALNRAVGNRRKAAQALGISERTLYRKIKEFGLG
ncbi:MAG TPA: sigma-54 dependent transcriptional regulator [Candidatus Krumholzibacteria bacterium]|nr:sigma-54 dependent transcriptional regulator [Candidatus Krumholzibacteria bacterium]